MIPSPSLTTNEWSNECVSWEIDIFLKISLHSSFLKLQLLSELKEMTVKRKILVNYFVNQRPTTNTFLGWMSILHDVPRFHNWHGWNEFFKLLWAYFFFFKSWRVEWPLRPISDLIHDYHRDYYIAHSLHTE